LLMSSQVALTTPGVDRGEHFLVVKLDTAPSTHSVPRRSSRSVYPLGEALSKRGVVVPSKTPTEGGVGRRAGLPKRYLTEIKDMPSHRFRNFCVRPSWAAVRVLIGTG
jgi:hypothetical protein